MNKVKVILDKPKCHCNEDSKPESDSTYYESSTEENLLNTRKNYEVLTVSVSQQA